MSQYGAFEGRWAPITAETEDALPTYGNAVSLGELSRVTDALNFASLTAEGDDRAAVDEGALVGVKAGVGHGLGSGKAALGIPGVQKGFTPSAASKIPASAVGSLFKPGDRVMHRKFGEGNVVDIHGKGGDARIVISFVAYGNKEFALSIAPIVKVNEE